MGRLRVLIGCGAGVLALVAGSEARAEHFDIFVANDGGTAAVAGFDFDEGEISETRVFTGEMAADSGQFSGDEPGVVSGNPDPANMPAGWLPLQQSPPLNVGFNVLTSLGRNLLYWDGVGTSVDDVTLGPVSDGEVLSIEETGCFVCDEVLVDGGTSGLAGFVIDDTSNPVHEHPEFFLLGDATASDAVTPGIYVFSWEMTVSGLATSDPLWIVLAAFDPADYPELDEVAFDEFIDGQLDLAVGWVTLNLVPEPGTGLLLAAGLAGLARRGRRRG